MSRIKDLFGNLSGKKIKIEVEDKELELEMYTDDLHPLMTMNPEGQMSEEKAERITDILRKILYRSYLPHYNSEEDEVPDDLTKDEEAENEEAKEIVENLLLRHFVDIFTGIADELKWSSEADMSQIKQKKGKSQTG